MLVHKQSELLRHPPHTHTDRLKSACHADAFRDILPDSANMRLRAAGVSVSVMVPIIFHFIDLSKSNELKFEINYFVRS